MKWKREKEVSYTSPCNRYLVVKVYAYNFDPRWSVDHNSENRGWESLGSFEKFKDARIVPF